MYFYEGKIWELDFNAAFADAEAVVTIHRNTRWKNLRRYTARLQTELDNEGFAGDLTFYGNIAPFWPALLAGQFLHMGHAAVFGLGRYTCSVSNVAPISA
ncbi:MAG: CRISPR system precrRNA processing endoribonuclease RAMP protein Cas6 [Bacteroidetes Order II. Incertae sedis bacterium]|nr:CRISPR system precrRNA processing endoribonuclease RAMP protein Cas6 [Bacteroidetes Order II. bacterium]